MKKKLLLIVDPQIDFISGSLAVPQATEAMERLTEYVLTHGAEYEATIVTTDWHPAEHISFAPNGGQWPVHCAAFTEGARIYPSLLAALEERSNLLTVLRKGNTADREEYSIFRNKRAAQHICTTIQNLSITQIDLCGIAGDICVLDTLKDGVALLGKELFNVLPPYSPSLDGGEALSQALHTLYSK